MILTQEQALKQLVALHEQLKADRDQRLAHVQSVLEYTVPYKAAALRTFGAGEKPWRSKYDNSGMLNAARCAAGLSAELSPASRRWFFLAAPAASEAAADRGLRQSLSGQTERLHQTFASPDSSFHAELDSAYEDILTGTCCLGVKRDTVRPFIVSARPVSEYTFTVDEQGRPDQIQVERRYTAAEAAERFGQDKLLDSAREALARLAPSAFTERTSYLNVQRKSRDWDPATLGTRGFPYEDLWIECATNNLMERGGLRRLRYVVSRFWRPTGLIWGMGPSDMAYGPIRCADKFLEIALKYGATQMNPPTIWPDDGAWHPMDTTPGTAIVARAGAMDRGRPEYFAPPGDHRLPQFLLEYLVGQVAATYFAQIFDTIRDAKQRTAREVAAILQKDYSLMIPVFGRLKGELFAPLIRLCLELLTEYELGVTGWRYGGQPLPDLQYDLELISPLALAVRYTELQQFSDFMILHSQLAQIRPEVWDNYSLDDISRGLGDNLGLPERWKMNDYDRNRLRERRAELMMQREALEQAKLAGDATRGLKQAPEPGSPLAAMAAA